MAIQEIPRPPTPTGSIPEICLRPFLGNSSFFLSVVVKKAAQIGFLGSIVATLLYALNIGIFIALLEKKYCESTHLNNSNINGMSSQEFAGKYKTKDQLLCALLCLILTSGAEIFANIALLYGAMKRIHLMVYFWIVQTLLWVSCYISATIIFTLYNDDKMIVMMISFPFVVVCVFGILAVSFIIRYYKLLSSKMYGITVIQ